MLTFRRRSKSGHSAPCYTTGSGMSWERRTRGGLYYTRSWRIGGRIVREYVGTGDRAERAAQLDAMRRAAARDASAMIDEISPALRDADRAIRALTRAVLTRAGYHQHHRGEWRRQRVCA